MNSPRTLGLRGRTLVLDGATYVILALGAIMMVLPFLWMIATSFKLPADQYTKTLIPNPATLANFKELWGHLPFPRLMWNSFLLSVLNVVGQLLTCSMGAFVFAVARFRGRTLLFALLMVTLMIPSQVTLIPNFIIFRTMGVVDTQIPLWVPAFW